MRLKKEEEMVLNGLTCPVSAIPRLMRQGLTASSHGLARSEGHVHLAAAFSLARYF
jgi:hypothetical protein